MICRRCLQRVSGLVARESPQPTTTTRIRTRLPILTTRPFSRTTAARSSSPAPSPPDSSSSISSSSEPPTLSTPLGPSATDGSATTTPKSSCAEGTVLTGLNYFKNRTDPVALADDAYPEWLWRCLDVQKKADDEAADDAGDEFSKSKKQRRLAAKRQRTLEAQLLADGNLDALAPKIPLQQQSVNMPANEDGTAEGAVAAAAAREELRRAMRRERKAKIKESNYLKSM